MPSTPLWCTVKKWVLNSPAIFNRVGKEFHELWLVQLTAIYIKITIGLTAAQKPVQYVDNYLQVFFRHSLSLQSLSS